MAIPEGVIKIAGRAFEGCKGLADADMVHAGVPESHGEAAVPRKTMRTIGWITLGILLFCAGLIAGSAFGCLIYLFRFVFIH